MDFKDLQAKSETELQELLTQEQVALHKERQAAKLRQLKQVHTVRLHRKTIAQIKTVLAAKLK